MNILIWAFIFAVSAVALFLYAFWPSGEKRSGASLPSQPLGPAEPMAVKLEMQVNALESEIERLSSEHRFLQEQLELAKKIESDLGQELSNFKEISSAAQPAQPPQEKSQELLDKISSLEVQIREYKLELEKQGEMLEEIKGKENQGISQEEYNRLKDKLTKAEEVLRLIHAEG